MPTRPGPGTRLPGHFPWRILLIIIFSLLNPACSESLPSSSAAWESLIETLGDTTAAVVGVGEYDERLGGVAFGSVQSGTIGPGGEWFAVGDRDPPHVSVFRRNGTKMASFLERGEGPSESQALHHYVLADSDTTLLLLEGDQLRRFTLDGRELARIPLGALGYRPEAMGRGCGDAFFLLAPRLDPLNADGRVSWLHRIEVGLPGALELTPVWTEGLMYGRGQFLSHHRFLQVGDFLLIGRSTAEGLKEETFFCEKDGTLRPADEAPPTADTPVPTTTVIGRTHNPPWSGIEPGQERMQIVAAHPFGDEGILRVRQITYVRGDELYPSFDIQLSVQVGADTVASVRFPQYFEFLDVIGNRALVTHTDLIPRVFLYELPFSPE